MSNYTRGDYREKQAKAVLETYGYTVWQTRQSRTVVDLVCLQRNCQPLLVQVKIGSYIPHAEWNGLYRLAMNLDARPVVCTTEGNSPHITMQWRIVEGLHAVNSPVWPSRPMFLEPELLLPFDHEG